jgi:hypothetical protein
MARIFRFNQAAAQQLTFQAAQQAGLPMNLPQIPQGIQALLAKLSEYGIGLCVDDTSPWFQNLMANYGNNGRTDNVRVSAPRPPGPAPLPGFQPMNNPAQPAFVPPPVYQQPSGATMPIQGNYPPPVERVVPGAVISGQPLPDLTPPPQPGARMPSGVMTMPGGAVPARAPVMQAGLGDNPAGMTEPPPLPPTILD